MGKDWAKVRYTGKQIKDSKSTADAADKAEDAERGAAAISKEAVPQVIQGKGQADAVWTKYKHDHPGTQDSAPKDTDTSPEDGIKQSKESVGEEEKVSEEMGDQYDKKVAKSLKESDVDSGVVENSLEEVSTPEGGETDVHDTAHPNKDAVQVDHKILDDLEKEVDKATGKKKDWAKVRYTGKQIKDSKSTADAADKAEDAERGAAAISKEAVPQVIQGKGQADAVWTKYKHDHPGTKDSAPKDTDTSPEDGIKQSKESVAQEEKTSEEMDEQYHKKVAKTLKNSNVDADVVEHAEPAPGPAPSPEEAEVAK